MAKASFYRPHPRVQYHGTLTNPHTGEVTTPPSMTKQEFKKECDINNIIKHYSQTGMLQHVAANARKGAYLDLPDDVDFQTSLGIVAQAETAFLTLPSKIRERFDNEPAKFLAFAADPNNLDEMRKLGLANPLPPKRGGDGGDPPPVDSSESPKTEPPK